MTGGWEKSRSNTTRKAAGFIARLIDGRTKRFEDFADLAPNPKTRQRWLDTLVSTPELDVRVTVVEGVSHWRMNNGIRPSKVVRAAKICPKCPDILQPIDAFGVNRDAPDGHDWVCRKCRSEQHKEWVRKNKVHYNRLQRKNYRRRKKQQLRREHGGQVERARE